MVRHVPDIIIVLHKKKEKETGKGEKKRKRKKKRKGGGRRRGSILLSLTDLLNKCETYSCMKFHAGRGGRKKVKRKGEGKRCRGDAITHSYVNP